MIVKTFILENWRLIIDILSVICVTIFFFIKKKPIVIRDSLKQILTTWLPGVIYKAEQSGYKGEEKMKFALDLLYSLFAYQYLTREEFDNQYASFCRNQIEAILSTPQKKEVIKDGKK